VNDLRNNASKSRRNGRLVLPAHCETISPRGYAAHGLPVRRGMSVCGCANVFAPRCAAIKLRSVRSIGAANHRRKNAQTTLSRSACAQNRQTARKRNDQAVAAGNGGALSREKRPWK